MRARIAGVAAVALLMAILGGCAPAPAPPPVVSASGTADRLLVAVGNSFVGGSAMDSGAAHRWPALIAAELNMRLDVIAAGSSGYADAGDDDLTYPDLAQRIPADADVVVIMGSDDDAPHPPADIERGAREALTVAIARAPHARIIVTSTPWVEPDPGDDILNTRDAVRTVSSELGLTYVDGLGTWLVTGPPGQIGVDGLHPTDLGHAQIARDLIGPIRSAADVRP